jgi:hypothetical protein
VTYAARKTGETWEAALIKDGRFFRAFSGKTLEEAIGQSMMGWLEVPRNEGTEIGVSISINEPDAN